MLCHSVWCRPALPWPLLCGVHGPFFCFCPGFRLINYGTLLPVLKNVLIRGCFSERFFRCLKVPSVSCAVFFHPPSLLGMSDRAISVPLFLLSMHVYRVPNGCILTVVPRSRFDKSRACWLWFSRGFCLLLGHCYSFLCFSSPARVAFSENTKKKKTSFEIDQAAARPRPVTLASACKLHDTTIENCKADENQGRATFRWWHGRRK